MSKAIVDEAYINEVAKKIDTELKKGDTYKYSDLSDCLSVSSGLFTNALKKHLKSEEEMFIQIESMQREIMKFIQEIAKALSDLDKQFGKKSKITS